MGLGSEFQELGRFLDDCERSGGAVRSVDVADATDAGGEGIAATLELALSLDRATASDAALRDPHVCSDGTLRFALESTDLVPATDRDVAVELTDAALAADGTVTLTLAATVPDQGNRSGEGRDGAGDASEDRAADGDGRASDAATAGGDGAATASATCASGGVAGRDRDVPPFEDPELLADVYESCDTFAEMADALAMDVTAETVRRYMIDFDIHEPSTYRTGRDDAAGAGDDGRPVVLSDGIGLPDDVTVDALVETVKRSNTIYEVTQDVDVDREDALEMLQDLNLLDLVVGRLATEGERDITREDVVDRLRQASAVQ